MVDHRCFLVYFLLLLTHFLLRLHVVCLVPALAVRDFLLLLGLASRGHAVPAMCLLSSLFFGLGQLGFVLLHFVLVASSVLVLS